MNNRSRLYTLTVLLLSTLATPVFAYHLVQEIKLTGNEFWDYLSIDAAGERLYVSHGTHVDVIDTGKLAAIGAIADTPGVHGIAIANDLGRGYISAGATGSVVIFDLKTLARIGEVKTTGDNPDAILYDPGTQRVFTFNGRGRNVTAFDASDNKVIATITLDAKPEFAVLDDADHIFVNLEDRNQIAEIDPKTLTVLANWPLTGCEAPSGLAIDRAHQRLFSVCSNRLMIIVDATSGRNIAQLPIGAGVDGAGFDAVNQVAFAAAGEGMLTVVKEETPDRFTVMENVTTRPGARTMVVDANSHRVFLPTAQRGPAPPATAEQPRPRPVLIPDSFEVLVVEP